MGKEFTHEGLGAKAVLTWPFSGSLWAEYQATRRESQDARHDRVEELSRAALVLLEEGEYADPENGKVYDLADAGMDAPLNVLMWLAECANEVIDQGSEIPKA